MKRILGKLLWIIMASVVACTNENDADPILIYITPNRLEAQADDKIYFDIESKAVEGVLTQFEVSTFDKEFGSQKIYSTEPDSQTFSHRLIHTLPNYTEEQTVEFTFTAYDNLGNRKDYRLDMLVYADTSHVEELTGITLYSPYSGKNDGFSFDMLQSINSSRVESEVLDLYIAKSEADSTKLSKCWKSNTDIRFCRINNFNYAAATHQSISAVYSSSITDVMVDNLSIDDIIFVGRNKKAMAVIRIVNIYDEDGVEYDRYDINMKVLTDTLSDAETEDTETEDTETDLK